VNIKLKKTPEEKVFVQNKRMTNIVLAWCFLLDISVSVIKKAFRSMVVS